MSRVALLAALALPATLFSSGDILRAGTDCALTLAQGPRDALLYGNATTIRFSRHYAVMGGFRFRGTYSRGPAPTFTIANQHASVLTDLGAERTVHPENWYAVFAVANNGDSSAKVALMPFLRIGQATGNRLGLMPAGEGAPAPRATSYSWRSPNILAGTEALIISENGDYSGRVTKISNSDASSLTLRERGTIRTGDFILPAPPGFEHYLYIGTFYFDVAEVRNIYDSGFLVKARMIRLFIPGSTHGDRTQIFNLAGYISPLATASTLDSAGGLSTTSTGQYVEYFDGDGSGHTIDTRSYTKTLSTTESYVFSKIEIPFLRYQSFAYRSIGPLSSSRVQGGLHVTGWMEP